MFGFLYKSPKKIKTYQKQNIDFDDETQSIYKHLKQ